MARHDDHFAVFEHRHADRGAGSRKLDRCNAQFVAGRRRGPDVVDLIDLFGIGDLAEGDAWLGRNSGWRRTKSWNLRGAPCIAAMRKQSASRSQRLPKPAPHIRTAFSSIASKTEFKSPGELPTTRRTSDVAACCSSSSSRSRESSAIFVLRDRLRGATARGRSCIAALRRCRLETSLFHGLAARYASAPGGCAVKPRKRTRWFCRLMPAPRLWTSHGTPSSQTAGRAWGRFI